MYYSCARCLVPLCRWDTWRRCLALLGVQRTQCNCNMKSEPKYVACERISNTCFLLLNSFLFFCCSIGFYSGLTSLLFFFFKVASRQLCSELDSSTPAGSICLPDIHQTHLPPFSNPSLFHIHDWAWRALFNILTLSSWVRLTCMYAHHEDRGLIQSLVLLLVGQFIIVGWVWASNAHYWFNILSWHINHIQQICHCLLIFECE